ncbi:MAG: hypothetical protein HY608_10400 [Planctomycetes bacterium]|nr:hypothetical protein [Planctomycetota bacterium]
MSNTPPRLPRTVLLLGWVSLLTDVASEMVYPVLPLFLVGALGMPAAILGVMDDAGAVPWLFAAYGVYIALTHGVLKAIVTDLAPRSLRGTALGVFEMAGGLAVLVGSVAAGLLWDRVGHAAPFWLGAGCALAGAAVVPWVARAAPRV